MELRGLVVREPYVDWIVDGKKTWELRGSATMGTDVGPTVLRAWLRELPQRITAFVGASETASAEAPTLQAHGITRIARLEYTPSPRTFVGRGWSSRTRPGATLVDLCLEKKHEKLVAYRAKNGAVFQEYWLAIASSGPGTVEDGGFQMLIQKQYKTDYDRVFLIYRGSTGGFRSAQDVTPDRG